MKDMAVFVRRLANVGSYLRGNSIVLTKQGNTLVVDAGRNTRRTIKQAAHVFNAKAETLAG